METFDDLLQQVKDFSVGRRAVWFRGHSKAYYKLNSSIYRISKDKNVVETCESEIYQAFTTYGACFCQNLLKNEWDIVSLIQHYGLFTRLLDWTDSLAVALYFANLGSTESEDMAIWLLDPIALNEKNALLYGHDDKSYSNIGIVTYNCFPKRLEKYTEILENDVKFDTFAYLPKRNNDRLIAQCGYFTVQGNKGKPLEEEIEWNLENNCENSILRKINVPVTLKDEINQFLKMSGINYYSLFGGADGLCRYIKDELLTIHLNNV